MRGWVGLVLGMVGVLWWGCGPEWKERWRPEVAEEEEGYLELYRFGQGPPAYYCSRVSDDLCGFYVIFTNPTTGEWKYGKLTHPLPEEIEDLWINWNRIFKRLHVRVRWVSGHCACRWVPEGAREPVDSYAVMLRVPLMEVVEVFGFYR